MICTTISLKRLTGLPMKPATEKEGSLVRIRVQWFWPSLSVGAIYWACSLSHYCFKINFSGIVCSPGGSFRQMCLFVTLQTHRFTCSRSRSAKRTSKLYLVCIYILFPRIVAPQFECLIHTAISCILTSNNKQNGPKKSTNISRAAGEVATGPQRLASFFFKNIGRQILRV